MSAPLLRIDGVLQRIEILADQLRADPDHYVRRSAVELRSAFDSRRAIEPAVGRMRASVRMLRRENADGNRREFQRRALGLDQLEALLDQELLPRLRQVGFDV
jgi:hypothetical protein